VKKSVLKWLAALGGACLGVAIAHPRLARSADHLDAPATQADHTADINDVYTWMDQGNAIFAMTVFPAADTSAKFSDAIQYVFHTNSMSAYGAATSSSLDIICTFDTVQKISCWAGDEYATGNASAQIVQSKDTKMKIYAGLRKDPFFFNLEGFKDVTYIVADAGLTPTDFNDAGCPQLSAGTAGALRQQLNQQTDGGAAVDFFKDLKTLAIVISIEKSLVTKGGPIVSVWGSTNKKS